ncbi:hypothetical protein ILUMI_21001 [Ignelater luminosus]|uniref:Uncharacterized protein n=1 Tax=Ignelater luminosus TaxID=2038154 RepID=A0A8K0CJR4_IGNLU|nr:hypothetical protein ILUMI_21001 [Ignelater luminosus]
MDEALLVHVMTCNKASEMWVKLTSIYEQSTEMSLQILQGQFFSFKYDKSKDIATHISNMTTLVNKIKEAGELMTEEKRMLERKQNQNNSGNMALYARKEFCVICRKDNHKSKNCIFRNKNNTNYNKSSNSYSTYKRNHPNKNSKFAQTPMFPQQRTKAPHRNALIGMTMFNENLSDTETKEKWYLDSGHDMTYKILFTIYSEHFKQ